MQDFKMKHIGLFEGIGGFSLAARWAGWETVAWCEWNEFGQRVLKYHFPEAEGYGDITKTDFTKYANTIDVLTGGFPCQPYSVAGKRKGKEDERHLWPEMLRAIREIKPRWVVGENVIGLVNWNGGLVFEEVQADLEAEGYEVQPYILPACAKDAPHRRDRVWFVAYSNNPRNSASFSRNNRGEQTEIKKWDNAQFKYCGLSNNGDVANNKSIGRIGQQQEVNQRQESIEERSTIRNIITADVEQWNAMHTNSTSKQRQHIGQTGEGKFNRPDSRNGISDWSNFPTQSPICNGNDGFSSDTHINTLSNENAMDRSIVIKNALDTGRLIVDFEKGKIYSTRQRGKEGNKVELIGADCNGYIVHNIMFDGIKKQCRAHQIVWIAANGLYDKNVLMIDHINRIKTDNRLENLRLVDAKGNRDNATPYDGKISQEQKDALYFLHKEANMTIRELAEDFGISKSRVHQLISEHLGLDGITFPKWRAESIKAGGNAIVPQVAYEIFKAINAYETILTPNQ